MRKILKNFLFILAFVSTHLYAAQRNCLNDLQTHFEAKMPDDSFQWDFSGLDNLRTQANLIVPKKINGAVFFQAIAQQSDSPLYEYAFPLEALDHPLSTEAVQIEFIIQNQQLADLVINILYLEEPFLECSNKKSYSYSLKAQ